MCVCMHIAVLMLRGKKRECWVSPFVTLPYSFEAGSLSLNRELDFFS